MSVAQVDSFGFGGLNAVAIVEKPPAATVPVGKVS
jgi:acyl transferase domain-containing protein